MHPRPGRLAVPSAVRGLLTRYGIRPRKGWGQNFLVDHNIVDKIVNALDLRGGDAVLEIGPGLGALTAALAERGARVSAVEVDRVLVRALKEIFRPGSGVEIIHGDALQVDLAALARRLGPSVKAAGNLPYYITTPLLFRLLDPDLPLSIIVVMVQKEVAQRITAEPGGNEYGALSVSVAARARAEIIATVPRTVFYPPPEVASALVRLIVRPCPYPLQDPGLLQALIRAAFGQRRKTLRNALRARTVPWPAEAVDPALAAAGIEGERRGETLGLAEFVRLANALGRDVPGTNGEGGSIREKSPKNG